MIQFMNQNKLHIKRLIQEKKRNKYLNQLNKMLIN